MTMELEKRDLSISMVKANIVLLPVGLVILSVMLSLSYLIAGVYEKGSFLN